MFHLVCHHRQPKPFRNFPSIRYPLASFTVTKSCDSIVVIVATVKHCNRLQPNFCTAPKTMSRVHSFGSNALLLEKDNVDNDAEAETVEFCVFDGDEASTTASVMGPGQSVSRTTYNSLTSGANSATSTYSSGSANAPRPMGQTDRTRKPPPTPALRGVPMPDFATLEVLAILDSYGLPPQLRAVV